MKPLTGYCMALRRECEIVDAEVVVMKNGRKAIRGRAKDNPQYAVFKIVSKADLAEIEALLR